MWSPKLIYINLGTLLVPTHHVYHSPLKIAHWVYLYNQTPDAPHIEKGMPTPGIVVLYGTAKAKTWDLFQGYSLCTWLPTLACSRASCDDASCDDEVCLLGRINTDTS